MSVEQATPAAPQTRRNRDLPFRVRGRQLAQRLMGHKGRPTRTGTRLRLFLAVIVAVVAVAGAVVAVHAATSTRLMTIRADFTETPGVYDGNHVDVLGIPVGTVTEIVPHPGGVIVTMTVPRSLAIPADADAVLEAPDIVSDRYIQLTPVYRSGPRLVPGTTIPQRRTVVPLSLDQILDTFNQLAVALGPNGANRHGAVAQLVKELAAQLNGNGPALHATITSLGAALGALSGKGPSLTELLDNLGSLTAALSKSDGTYQQLVDNASSVATTLAADRGSLAGALSTLQQALGQVTTTVRQDGGTLGSSIDNLQETVGALDKDQQQLAKAWDLGPLALENFDGAIDESAPGGPALVATLDPTSDSDALVQEVCGSPQLRNAELAAEQSSASTLDLACNYSDDITDLPDPPGSTTGPNMSLSALVGSGS